MKLITCFFGLLLFINSYAGDGEKLEVEQDGLVVVVLDFEEGDKIKLFEIETGDHVLSKTHGQIDLSQLPIGAYLLENNEGRSIVIERLEEGLNVDGAITAIHNDFLLERDSKRVMMPAEIDVEQEYMHYYDNAETNLLAIEREGDMITVVDFEEGDKIKLFEVKNTVHILTKTSNFVDLSQLPAGVYVLENSKGDSVVVEKFYDKDQVADMH
ncbi:T9SS type A sorting domain-containing protein [Aquimarina sp. D1M17]|uniref:T9SS type A sorting domain-containing protein n=1 Tax=Aquimarina acroporae TaxID=2937283 RepID=UPI0020BF3E17|nr:T9SS type A sorting domain-containing protein [Aquimarina acroporae]MCK8522009.1 T9SS type A sorting domain-containing protein [Aquimarina acroporae]